MEIKARHIVLASLVLAALTLLFPSSPTYDPWSWIVWGREIMHLDLNTADGPSWKPLPILFTAPFSLTGSDVAPMLWLVVARAGGIAAVVMMWVVGRRLGGVVAGAAAAGGLVIAPWFLRNVTLGNSEGLMAAVVLAAIERHIAGKPRQAFWFGLAAALLRPEAWPFFGLYGLWMLWRYRRLALRPVVLGFLSLPVLWLGPEYWGSGNALRASDRAQQPLSNSPAFADHPVLKLLENAADLVTWPVWAGIAVAGLVLLLTARDRRRKGSFEATATGALAVLALAWVGIVAYMTSDGFSGNQRYLIVPAVLATLVGAIGLGWVADRLPAAARPLLALVAAVAFLLPATGKLSPLLEGLRYQGHLPHQLAAAVEQAGGAAAIKRCGDPYTGPFLVPAVAWQLHVHTGDVNLRAKVPAVVFRTRTNPGNPSVPTLRGLGSTPTTTLARSANWRIVAACRVR